MVNGMIGNVRGYNICVLTIKKLAKEELFKELVTQDKKIIDEIKDVLENKGYVIGLKKQKSLKAIYVFNFDSEEKSYNFCKNVILEEVSSDAILQFESAIKEELREKVCLGTIAKVNWEDIIIEPKQFTSFSASAFSVCISLGLLYGVIFDNIAIGLIFGMAIGLSIGAVIKKK